LSLQIGYNKGDGVLYYEHPSSRTSAALFLNQQTNVGVPGRFIYRVNGDNAISPCSLPTGKCIIHAYTPCLKKNCANLFFARCLSNKNRFQ